MARPDRSLSPHAARGGRDTRSDTRSGSDIGDRVRAVRERSGMSLRALADRIGVSPTTMSQLEIGRTQVSAVRLAEIAAALDVGLQELLGADPARGRAEGPDPVPSSRTQGRSERVDALIGAHPAEWREFPPLRLDPVLTAAVGLFSEAGYHGTTIRDIAGRADVSTPALYYHYASKQDVLAIVVAVAARETLRHVRAAAAGSDEPDVRLARMTEALALCNTLRNDIATVAFTEFRHLDAASRREIARDRSAIQGLFDSVVESGVRQARFATARPRESARAVVMLCTALITWFRTSGPVGAEQVAREHADFALRLVEARP
ncbi:TetR family transcriptional regulator [Pseudonocardia abyssalis]|uniref:TetR family transcriptional regulator n=1 Tax=Pseudonocardia abyssalis TaxID=2792008 RepID=A0ABS6UR70_9PSEU|nr:TetR family transcriptional regulator [Pseudonocardia abyssalis]MBW0118728.1 TetR family transcriptional regulator [Pseudonocardia abyssalis]MBW0134753.1 TetR family transcriptional regulator [Pseudonocardia abyssalis]